MTHPSTSGKLRPELSRWHEVFAPDGARRSAYDALLRMLEKHPRADLRTLEERIEAALRELGVNFRGAQGHFRQAWRCDLLPQIFSDLDWRRVVDGVRQRLRAFELFLQDVYGKRQILRDNVVPIHPVLGSSLYLNPSVGLPLPESRYLHMSGLCLARLPSGALAVRHHQFSRPSGISYMMQNRRALARVLPEFFEENMVRALAGSPLRVLEMLRAAAPKTHGEPSVVLLSAGIESPVYSDHSFLARRMGIPVVQGGDLLVLDTTVYLKTVRGLKRVDVIFNHIADEWLDPLVFKRSSMVGVPGLVHCVRSRTVVLMNAVGSQLADDRVLLSFAPRIIQYYLAENPILPSLPTHWLGDLDQCEMVLDSVDDYQVQQVDEPDLKGGDRLTGAALAQAIRKEPSRYVAQRRIEGVATLRYEDGKAVETQQDHMVYASSIGNTYDVYPGALTRIFDRSGGAWETKDTWVMGQEDDVVQPARPRRAVELTSLPSRDVTSRMAESFYWLGRYLERAYQQAYLIQVVETLETEELNSAERKLYRPMWNRLLPPLEKSSGSSRRSITTRRDRYRLLLSKEPGTVISAFQRAMDNAESVQEALSPEAWATLSGLALVFQKTRLNPKISEDECARVARKLSETVTQRIPQFFAVASRTGLGDDGWRFCLVGEALERALHTVNAIVSISKSLARPAHSVVIELSAFLRLLGTRDAYRRIFQMRSEPIAVLELLWQHPEAPRSVYRCLKTCRDLLAESASDSGGATKALNGIDLFMLKISRIDWTEYLPRVEEEMADAPSADGGDAGDPQQLSAQIQRLLGGTLNIHNLISDAFLSHQAIISEAEQPFLQGLGHGI